MDFWINGFLGHPMLHQSITPKIHDSNTPLKPEDTESKDR